MAYLFIIKFDIVIEITIFYDIINKVKHQKHFGGKINVSEL